tara:strand:+ start:960 stop:1343 length:384 start_codon:yes stop_codon:yes gene_type:complete
MAYKMKGFGGFGNPAPAKQIEIKSDTTKPRDPEKPFTQEEASRGSGGVRWDGDSKKHSGKQVPLSKHEEKKGTMITGGSEAEVITDLEDRIEFLNSDISDESSIMKKGKMITQRDKLKSRLKQERAK